MVIMIKIHRTDTRQNQQNKTATFYSKMNTLRFIVGKARLDYEIKNFKIREQDHLTDIPNLKKKSKNTMERTCFKCE